MPNNTIHYEKLLYKHFSKFFKDRPKGISRDRIRELSAIIIAVYLRRIVYTLLKKRLVKTKYFNIYSFNLTKHGYIQNPKTEPEKS